MLNFHIYIYPCRSGVNESLRLCASHPIPDSLFQNLAEISKIIGSSLKEQCFCLSSSPDKQKVDSLRPLRLCGEMSEWDGSRKGAKIH